MYNHCTPGEVPQYTAHLCRYCHRRAEGIRARFLARQATVAAVKQKRFGTGAYRAVEE